MSRLLLLLLCSVSSLSVSATSPAKLSLFVSIPPQAWLLEQLGGERLDINTMLGPNANPHNYDPMARQLVTLNGAQAYFTIGIPFESMWQKRLAAINERMEFIHCGADTDEHDHGDHGHGEHEHGTHSDPHIWTSPLEAGVIAACMHKALVRLDPAGAALYSDNLQRLQQQLTELDEQIRELLADQPVRIILVQHPAWDHFAANYDLEQFAIEQDGHEPNARHLVYVIERSRKLGLKQIFVQRQYSVTAARLVAEAIGARLVEADPMSRDYPASLLQLAKALAEQQQSPEQRRVGNE